MSQNSKRHGPECMLSNILYYPEHSKTALLLPSSAMIMCLQICLRHQINSSPITPVIPGDMIWIMTGSDCIDMIAPDAFNVPFLVASVIHLPLRAFHSCRFTPLMIRRLPFSSIFPSFNSILRNPIG